MSVESGADPGLGSQPAVDIVMNLAVGCDLFVRPTVTLPAREHPPLAGTKLYCLVTEAHWCEQLAQSHYIIMQWPGVEPATSRSRVQDHNHYTAKPLR